MGARVGAGSRLRWRLGLGKRSTQLVVGVAEFLQPPLEESSSLVLAENTVGDETRRIGLAYGRLVLDTLGLERLCVGRLILLVVAKPSVTDEIDDNVVAELGTVGEGEPDSRQRRLGIVGVDVDDRDVEALGEVARIAGSRHDSSRWACRFGWRWWWVC